MPLPGLSKPHRIRDLHLRGKTHRPHSQHAGWLEDRAAGDSAGPERAAGQESKHLLLIAMLDLMTLKPGDRLLLQKGIVAEVTENMGDGQWVEARLIEAPEKPSDVGTVELCHAQDIVKVLNAS